MKKSLFGAVVAGLVVGNFSPFLQAAEPGPATLRIDLAAPAAKVSPRLYGLMTEEINHSYDGGLYAELIRNRAFRDDPNNPVHWTLAVAPGAAATMALTEAKPLTDKLPVSLAVDIKAATPDQRVTISNDGYWGIPVRPETTYRASFWVKGSVADKPPTQAFEGGLRVALVSADGGREWAQAETGPVNGHWQKFDITLRTGAGFAPSATNRFVISAGSPGTLWFSLVSLFPPTYRDRANGNRIDLSEKLAAMKPRFLRFPGGNYLEGNKLWERFAWKETRGPLEFRPGHPSCWNYRSTDGMGLLEFMGWCEDLEMEPVLAVYAGYSLDQQSVEPGPLLEPYVQEALDEIEYLTGDAKTTHWGAMRAKDGHPEPFHVKYVEIGNEDKFDHTNSYDARFAQYFDAFKANYPDLQLIATTPVKSRRPDVIDEHYYRKAADFFRDIHHYDHYDRSGPKVFVGEWATREGEPTPNFQAALGDAAWMTGMERNSDHVIMHAYAPLLVNVNPGGMQWKTNLIGYDALTSYGSPSYYAQVMFSNHVGPEIPRTTLEAAPDILLPYSVTRDPQTGRTFIKVVNPGDAAQTVNIDLTGGPAPTNGTAVTLQAAHPSDTNTITEPEKIVPQTTPLKDVGARFAYAFPPRSITVLELRN